MVSLRRCSSSTRRALRLLVSFLGLCSASGFGLQPSSPAGEYIRTDFTVEEGLPDNVVNAIAQSDNGLLWVGTQTGLATFDGRGFHLVHFNIPKAPSQGAIHSLLVDSTGDLWIGSDAGVVLIPKGSLDDTGPKSPEFFSMGGKSEEGEALLQARNGDLWVGTGHGLFKRQGNTFVNVLPDIYVSRISETLNGHLLIITGEKFLEFDGQKIIEHSELARQFGVRDNEIFDAHQDRRGATWFNTIRGVFVERGNVITHPLPSQSTVWASSERTYEDRQGNIWVSTGTGAYRWVGDRLESPGTDVVARCIFVSRDGGLWMGTNGNGLVRFRTRVVRMFSTQEGLPVEVAMAVLPAHDGRLWIGGNCGLSVYDGRTFKNYGERDGLRNTCVWTLAEDGHQNLWIGTYGGGLFRFNDGHFTQYGTEQGFVSKIVFQIQVAHDDSLWIATPDGVSHLQDGHFQNYTTADGLADKRVLSVHEDQGHRVWAATQTGTYRLNGNKFVPFASTHGANDQLATRFAEDSSGDLYTLNAVAGAGIVEDGRVRTVQNDLNMIDMVESADHSLWFSSRNGIFRFARDQFRNAGVADDAPLEFASIDRADGLSSTQCSVGSPNIALTRDHKLWVATVKGLAMVDLDKWPGPSRKPHVFLQGATVEGTEMHGGGALVLPAGTHRVEFHLAAVDLASPEKIRLQYRIEGADAGWVTGDATRTAVYTNIPPGAHTLLVRATDSNGKWDRAGKAFAFTQQPFFYQTIAFESLCFAVAGGLLWFAYFIRVRHLINHTRALLEERQSERERIARDLHDTFFQGIQGLLLRFNTATARLPSDEPARRILIETLEQSDRVMLEGRELVLDLRADETAARDLPEAFARAADEFTGQDKPDFKVIVVGQVRRLHPVPATEIFRIGREALSNAFRHAASGAVELEVTYRSDMLRVCIRDDGKGIDEEVLRRGGRPGHLGLPGMHERAERIGAIFKIWSRRENGTEIEITVPAAVAYSQSGDVTKFDEFLQWLGKNSWKNGDPSG